MNACLFLTARAIRTLAALLLLGLFSFGAAPTVAAEEPAPPASDAERIERALDSALDAIATGMQTLVVLAEKSQEKWSRCRSGHSEEAWCVKMKDALTRLERLSGGETSDDQSTFDEQIR
ncbi:MAG: hypothetical protein HY282_12385 [Nitrospirae bacterium]|nr:hypothetical protein [Candidatus Manganitrophaceae bacterium]